ncbi:histidine phosphatase superfamily [Xylaria bambusicola]|uniref:histidine phosphatase superfamily n=1 Tax=Xylaria bambusicola TaxID=326684 RepID=UPI0020088492|nr:histidine phosphatase superfamily [Xylaria bambusicola]KAI0521351.1 histidine phosphatase superfamily [Xylaria bambusicola]
MTLSEIKNRITSLVSGKQFSYSALPENVGQEEPRKRAVSWAERHKSLLRLTGVALLFAIVGIFGINFTRTNKKHYCDHVKSGFQCEPAVSHSWGQYSPYFSVPSEIPNGIPKGCELTFAQVLSRHGARDPTLGKSLLYAILFEQIHNNVTDYSKQYSFIKDYKYSLGADELTVFGQQQLVYSGINFYQRYEKLARNVSPFVRTAGQKRVVDSAVNWTQGFHQARLADKKAKFPDAYPYEPVILPEVEGFNNTLSPMTCTAFNEGPDTGNEAQTIWVDTFVPPIAERVNKNLIGANLTNHDIIHLMDICPFETVANKDGHLSPFCDLFTEDEWHGFDYYQTLGKWYGYTNGSPLGPTQGVGFVNELVARLTGQPVVDATTTNSTLDKSRKSFPLDSVLYADFSHDNDMSGMFGALGLYNATEPLSNTTKASPKKTKGYAASWAVPFAARMYVEKMQCDGVEEEFVRVLVNDRVIPLQNCDVDALGRCTLSKYVDSLSFARQGGHWDKCYE